MPKHLRVLTLLAATRLPLPAGAEAPVYDGVTAN
ncbi:tol-pal system protein YbgF, partial [Pseudomonas aeruginosa]